MNPWLLLNILVTGLTFLAVHIRADTSPHAYPAHGTIEGIAADYRQVTIHYQAIPGYMMEMTMDFTIRDTSLLAGLRVGDKIDFTLEVTATDSWIDAIHRTGHIDLAKPSSPAASKTGPRPGDLLPDTVFTSEDNKEVHLSDFRGRVLVATFFFTRCPLPNYCPLMNRNFGATRKILSSDAAGPKKWQFLSISFDPEFDTPKTLANYGDFYRDHNRDRWLFVSASPSALAQFATPLGLTVMPQGASLNHNLRTVVIDPKGRLYGEFNDNQWTPQQLADSVKEASKASSK